MDLLGPVVGGEVGRVAVGIAHRLPQSRGLGRLDARSADALDEQAAEEKGLVAQASRRRAGTEGRARAAGWPGPWPGSPASRASSAGRSPTSPGAS